MHARLLSYVDEVARQGSIRGASEKLNVAASAISRQIKALEDELGTPLFHRTTRSLTLTSAGEIVLLHIRDTLRDMNRTRALLEDLKGLRRGEVRVAMMSGLAANIVSRVVLQFRQTNPWVNIGLQLMTAPDQMIGAIVAGDADLALGFDFPHRANVRPLAVALAQLGVVVAGDHPFAGRASVRLAECFDHTMVLADDSTVIRPRLDQLFGHLGLTPRNVIETNSIEVMRQLTMSGKAVTFLTAFDIEIDAQAGRLRWVPVLELARETQQLVLLGPERNASALASVLAEQFKTSMGDGAVGHRA